MMRLPFLQRNPLTMVGTLDQCWLFAYRTPQSQAERYLPEPLQLVTRGDYAFWNIVVSHISRMRPKGLPHLVGLSYWHVAYRLYVRLPHLGMPSPIEGLYFVRSDSDNALMSLGGNLLTDYRFHTSKVSVDADGRDVRISVSSSDASAEALLSTARAPSLQPGSPFDSVDEAAAFLKYKPFGISVDENRGELCVVRIVRNERRWKSYLPVVESATWGFFAGQDVKFEVCYRVDPIEYQWNRGHLYHVRMKE